MHGELTGQTKHPHDIRPLCYALGAVELLVERSLDTDQSADQVQPYLRRGYNVRRSERELLCGHGK